MVNNNTLIIEFDEKFTSVNFDNYIEHYFNKCFDYQNIIFQLENIEWIALEEIVFLFGWIRYIKKKHPNLKQLKVIFPSLYPNPKDRKEARKHERLLNLWNVWKIWKICDLDISKETNIDTDINKYVTEYYQRDTNWHTIVPFSRLDSKDITSFKSVRNNIEKSVDEKFDLTTDVEQLLEKHSSLSVFENKALSGIITTELFLNSAVHAYTEDEKKQFAESYFAVSLRNKIDIEAYKENKIRQEKYSENVSDKQVKKDIDRVLQWNLEEKSNDEKPYFEDESNNNINIATNDSFIEFTFLDFGVGIPRKLQEKYEKANIASLSLSAKHQEKDNNGNYLICEDSRILEYAFLLDTSSNPLNERLEINDYVPRGLFFLVDIIRRYKGLLMIRSGNGKIIFDFKNTSKISKAVRFSKQDSNLPLFRGTLISIYLPAKTEIEISRSTFEISFENKTKIQSNISGITEYINVNEILKINQNKDSFDALDLTQIYNSVFKGLNKKIDDFSYKKCTVYIDFSGSEDLSVINRKLYFYLCSSPRFDKDTNIVIIHPSNIGELYQIKEAIRQTQLSIINKPVPCLISHSSKSALIVWLGISNEVDEEILNAIYSKKKARHLSLFFNKKEIGGNVIKLTDEDFVTLNIGTLNIQDILKYYSPEFIYNEIPKRFIIDCIKDTKYNILYKDDIYWASGGYYQDKFIALLDALYRSESDEKGIRGETMNARFGERVARYLIEKYNFHNDSPLEIDCIVAVTLSGQLLGKHIKDMYSRIMNNKKKPQLIRLANYHEFTSEDAFRRIKPNQNVLIVNDVISTGNLSIELSQKLITEKQAKIAAIFTLFDSRDPDWKLTEKDLQIAQFYFPKDENGREQGLYKLYDYPIKKHKYRRKIDGFEYKKVVSIDPVINAPSMMNLDRSMGNNLQYFEKKDNKKNEHFLDIYAKNESLWIGHFHHNMHHHLYYFKTKDILCSERGSNLLNEIFESIWNKDADAKEVHYIFFPMFSAIEELTTRLEDNYPNVQPFPLPRIDTPKGWRFSFPPKSLNAEGWNYEKRNVIIIDDGCSTGDTILQMIDSVAMIEVNKIIVISVIARLEDFQREFYSRINSVKGFKQFRKEPYIVSQGDTWDSIAEHFFEESDEKATGKEVKIFAERIKKHNKELIQGEKIGLPLKKDMENIIPLNVYFGAHFHIPVFSPIRNCPFCIEWSKLEEEFNRNPPDSAKEYIKQRKREIALYDTDGTLNPQTPIIEDLEIYNGLPSYLPRNIDVKKIFLARDVIGKIDTYRLYRDYIKDSDSSDIFYDGIEIDYYLAVILHEERLISSIGHLLPQLKSKLIKAIKNKLSLETTNPNIQLKYDWQHTQIIKALFLLSEENLYDLSEINAIVNFMDIGATNYLTYLYWEKIFNIKNDSSATNKYINLLDKIAGIRHSDININRVWGQFRKWVLDKQTEYEWGNCGNSFKFLKHFYIRKQIEYPNHDTVGNLFKKNLSGSIKTTIFTMEQLGETIDESYIVERFNYAKTIFNDAHDKIKSPFLEIRNNEKFQDVLKLCGEDDKFLKTDENNICEILNKMKMSFVDLLTFKKEMQNIVRLSEIIYDKYFTPNSDYGNFFLKHEFNIKEVFDNICANFSTELKDQKITLKILNIDVDEKIAMHPNCFELIINELFNNSIRYHNTSITFNIEKDNNCIIIFFEGNFKENASSSQSHSKGGLLSIKNLIEYFGGSCDDNLLTNRFTVKLSIPIVQENINL